MLKIYTLNDSSPELLETQVASFRKYLMEDFEFIVVNSESMSEQPTKAKEITRISRELSVKTLEVVKDEEIVNLWQGTVNQGEKLLDRDGRYVRGKGGDACNYMLQWLWNKVVCLEQGPICIVHSDLFLVAPVKLTDYLKDYHICSVLNSQPNTNHPDDGPLVFLWETLFLVKPSEIPNPETMVWFPSRVEGSWCDTGGPTHYYLKAHPEVRLLAIEATFHFDDPNVDFHPSRYQFFYFDDKKIALHYQSGSRWCTDLNKDGCWNFSQEKANEYHVKKLAWARKIIGL